jgi:hypothetical protein
MIRVVVWLGAPAIMLLVLFGTARSAEAYTLNGCKYPGTDPVIEYKFFSVTGTWQLSHMNGAGAWNTWTTLPGVFVSTSGSDPEIRVYDGDYAWGYVAVTSGGCASGGGQPWYNDRVDISYNTRTTDGYSSIERRLVATHELGHAYGLGHSTLGCSNPVVMRSEPTWTYNQCGTSSAPHPNDRFGVTDVYN